MLLFFSSLLGSLAGFFGQWITKKAALGAAAVTLFAGITLAFAATLKALAAGVVYAVPSSCAVGYCIPSNLVPCVSAVLAALMARWVYDWHRENIRLMAYVT